MGRKGSTMTTRLATCNALAILVLSSPRPASAGCHFWSFADINIYVYEFGRGRITMIIPASGGHTFPTVLSTPGGAGGGGNEIRDFSLAQEACIWFGDGCTRTVGY
jgi:hypothetical protein